MAAGSLEIIWKALEPQGKAEKVSRWNHGVNVGEAMVMMRILKGKHRCSRLALVHHNNRSHSKGWAGLPGIDHMCIHHNKSLDDQEEVGV